MLIDPSWMYRDTRNHLHNYSYVAVGGLARVRVPSATPKNAVKNKNLWVFVSFQRHPGAKVEIRWPSRCTLGKTSGCTGVSSWEGSLDMGSAKHKA